MRINKISLKNFKNFESKEQSFDKLNFVSGINGSGKSTLILDAILFGFWGYSYTTLASLPTRDKASSCTVEIEFTEKNDTYIIKRSYPTAVEVIKNGEKVKFSISIEANSYLTNIVGTREMFVKFNLINAYDKETDLLSAGQMTIKKTLFSLTDELFNNAKLKLSAIKSERERFNKDGATVYTHYPSQKRLAVLDKSLLDLTEQYKAVVKELNEFTREYNKEVSEKGNKEGQKSSYSSQKNKILSQPDSCYACGQDISKESYSSQLKEINENIERLNAEIGKHIESLDIQKDIMQSYESNKDKIDSRRLDLITLQSKLKARMKQSNLIYSTKDVVVVKKALTELDNLSSFYLKESLKTLEPIVNSILQKIGFQVEFTIDTKGHFAIVYKKENIIYTQKDLSTGQNTIMQIAFKLALLISMNKSGIMIADEGLGSLDEENLLHVINIFENYPMQLFMVLHNSPELPNSVKTIKLGEQI